MHNAFTKYVSESVVDEALAGESLKLGGERIKLTILVSDLRDFTSLSESMDPEGVIAMLDE